MSRFFHHPAYAEDQPLSKTILTTHVLTRGFQTGAFIGLVAGGNRLILSPSYRAIPIPVAVKLVRSAGVGAVIGTGLLSVGLAARMYGKESIEWNDRSWRLLENQGQVEVDDWSYGGAAVGMARTAVGGLRGWRPLLGGAGLGSLAGVAGYMIWKYGVNGGRKAGDWVKSA